MEHCNQAHQVEETQTKQEEPRLTDQQQAEIRQMLFESFGGQYQSMMQTVVRAPIAENLKQIVIQHFDTGMLWAKEAFNLMQVGGQGRYAAPVVPLQYVNDIAK